MTSIGSSFGRYTMSANMPRAFKTSNDMKLIDQINSAFTTNATQGQQGPQGKLTADVAKDFASIRESMTEQPQNRSLLGRIADFFVNKQINDAAKH